MFRNALVLSFVVVAAVCSSVIRAEEGEQVPYETKAAETLGATLVAYSIDAHVNISLVAQAYQNETLESERALSLANLTITMLDQIGPSVIALTKYSECGDDDRKCLVSLAKAFKAIKAEAVALKAYIESEDESDFEAFEAKQQEAQNVMDNLMK
jgi:hypothetical protein